MVQRLRCHSGNGLGLGPERASCVKTSNLTNYVGGCRGLGQSMDLPCARCHLSRRHQASGEGAGTVSPAAAERARGAEAGAAFPTTAQNQRSPDFRLESEASQWNAAASGKRHLLSKLPLPSWPPGRRCQAWIKNMPMQGALPSNFRAFRCRHLPGTRHRHGSRKMGQWLQDFSSTFLLREEQHCSIGRAWRRLWTARSCDLELRSAARTSLAALELVARAWHHMASKQQFSQRGNDIGHTSH